MRNLIRFFFFIAIILAQIRCELSGIKAAINVKALEGLKDFPFDHFLPNTTFLTKGKKFGNSFTSMTISNLKIQNIAKPGNVEAYSDTPNDPSIDLTIENGEVDLLMDIQITTLFVIHHELKQALVKVPIKQLVIRAGINKFNHNYFQIERLIFTPGEIEVPFKSILLKAVLFLLNKVGSFFATLFTNLLSTELDTFLNTELRSDIKMNLGNVFNVDLTVTDYLNIVNYPLKNLSLNTYLTIGDKALLTTVNPYHFNFENVLPMNFTEIDYQHEFSLLISDYTINTLFYIVQQGYLLDWTVPYAIFPEIPYSLDVDGFSQLVPEFKTFFSQNYAVNYEVKVDPLLNTQPIVKTVNGVTRFYVNFNTSIYVSNFPPDSFQNPVLALDFNTTAAFDLIFGEKIFEMNFGNLTIDYFNVNSQIGKIDVQSLQKNVFNLILNSFPIFRENVENFNVKKFLHREYYGFNESTNLTEFEFKRNKIVSGNGFINVLLDKN